MELSRTTFDELRQLIQRLCGIVLADEKEYLVRHRLEPLVKNSGCRTFDEFSVKLSAPDGQFWHEAVIEAITTQETSFFRDRHPFEAIRSRVLPDLIASIQSQKKVIAPQKIRCLSCGAATGQEPYSLAMLICEFLAAQHQSGIETTDFSILATDISTRALAMAAEAKYSRRDLDRGVSPTQAQLFFDRQDDNWILKQTVRRLVEFRRVNMMQSLAFLGNFQLILCRNVLIYFDMPTRQKICSQLYEMLSTGGWFLLGSAESLFGIDHRFQSLRIGDTLIFHKFGGSSLNLNHFDRAQGFEEK